MKTKHLILTFIIISLVFSNSLFAQSNYADFKSVFKPSQQLFSPDNLIVYDFQKMNLSKQISTLEAYIKAENLKSFSLIIISIDRSLAGVVLDGMHSELTLKGLGFLADKWALEVLYYVSESTYSKLSELSALKNFKMVSSLH